MGSEVTITIKGVDDFSKVADKITERMEHLSGAMSKVFEKAGQSAKTAKAEIGKIGTESKKTGEAAQKMGANFGLAVSIIVRGARQVKAMLSSIGDAVSKTAKLIGTGFGQALNEIGSKLATFAKRDLSGNFLSRVVQGTREAINTVVSGATTAIQGGIRAATQLVTGFAKVVGEMAGLAATMGGGLVGALFGMPGVVVGTILGDLLGEIPRQVMNMASGVVEGVGRMFEGVVGVIGGVFSAGVNLATAALNGLLSFTQGIVEKIGDTFGSIVGKLGSVFGQIAEKLSMVFTGIVGFATHKVLEMEKQISVAFGLIPDAGEEAFQEMTDRVAALSRKTPFVSGGGLAKGLFQAISAGARDPSQAMGILGSAAQASVAGGLSDVDQTVKALTRTTLLFNKEVGETTDILFQTQNLGQLTFGELASGLGLVLGMAKSANVELMDLMTGIAAGSRGLDPASLFTGMRRAIQTLASPTPDAAKARRKTGLEFKELSAEERKQLGIRAQSIDLLEQQISLYERLPKKTHTQRMMLKDLKVGLREANEEYADSVKAMGKFVGMMESIERIRSKGLSFEQLREVVPELRAQTFIATVLGLDPKQLADIKTKIKDFTGATQKAFDLQTNTIRGQLSLAWKGLTDIIFKVKEALKPHLMDALRAVNKAILDFADSDAFASVREDIVKTTIAVGEFVVKSITWFRKNWESIKAGAKTAYKAVETVALASWTIIKKVWKFGETFFTSQDTEHVRTFFKDAWKIITELAQGNTKPLTDVLNSVWVSFKETAIRTWNEIIAFMVDKLREVSLPTPGAGGAGAGGGGSSLIGMGKHAWDIKKIIDLNPLKLVANKIIKELSLAVGKELGGLIGESFRGKIEKGKDAVRDFADEVEKLKTTDGQKGGPVGMASPVTPGRFPFPSPALMMGAFAPLSGAAGRPSPHKGETAYEKSARGKRAFEAATVWLKEEHIKLLSKSIASAIGDLFHDRSKYPTGRMDPRVDPGMPSLPSPVSGGLAHGAQPTSKAWTAAHKAADDALNKKIDGLLKDFYEGVGAPTKPGAVSFLGGMNQAFGGRSRGPGSGAAYQEYKESLRSRKAFIQPQKADRPLFPTGFGDPLFQSQQYRDPKWSAQDRRRSLGSEGIKRARGLSQTMESEFGIKDIPAHLLYKAGMEKEPQKGLELLKKALVQMVETQKEKGDGNVELGEELQAAVNKMTESIVQNAEAQAGMNEALTQKTKENEARLDELNNQINGGKEALEGAKN